MTTFKRGFLVLTVSVLSACGQHVVEFPRSDAAVSDLVGVDGLHPDGAGGGVAIGDAGNTGGMNGLGGGGAAGPASGGVGGGRGGSIGAGGSLGGRGGALAGGGNGGVVGLGGAVGGRGGSAVGGRGGSAGSAGGGNAGSAGGGRGGNVGGGGSAGGRGGGGGLMACVQAPVVLGAAANFVVLAGSTVTSTGLTTVTGDLGVSPGTAVTGFPPGVVVGAQHVGDPTADAAEAALTTAYDDAAGRTLCPVTISGNLGGQTLPPGLYKSTSSLAVSSGDLTLDAQGDPSAVFIFQMASTLTTTAGRQVILSGGAKSSNVFWQVGTSATLGSTSVFQGTVMADQAITMNTGAILNGRVMARVAAVALDANVIVQPAP